MAAGLLLATDPSPPEPAPKGPPVVTAESVGSGVVGGVAGAVATAAALLLQVSTMRKNDRAERMKDRDVFTKLIRKERRLRVKEMEQMQQWFMEEGERRQRESREMHVDNMKQSEALTAVLRVMADRLDTPLPRVGPTLSSQIPSPPPIPPPTPPAPLPHPPLSHGGEGI